MVKAVLGVPWDHARNVEKGHGYAEKGIPGRRNGNCPQVLSYVSRHQILISNSSPDIPILVRTREENQKTRFQLYIGYNVLHIKDFMFVTNQMKSFLLRIFCSLPIPVRI